MSLSWTPEIDPFLPGLVARLPEAPRRVILLRASRIGDFLCAVPAFRSLRTALPEAEFSLITLPLLKDLAARLPYFEKVLDFPGYPGLAEQLFDPRKTTEFLRQAQEYRYDLAIQMQGSGINSNPFTLMLGARYTAGFVRKGDGPGRLDAAVAWPEEAHEIDRNLRLASFLGAPFAGKHLEFPLWPEDNAAANLLLKELPGPLIGLHTSARDLTRRWPLERFKMVGRELLKHYGGSLVLVGEPEDAASLDELGREVGGPTMNLAGKTSLPVLGALIASLELFITNDTGPAHIAYALQTPVITIFGSGDPTLNGPQSDGPHRVLVYPVECRPCGLAECPIGYKCLDNVTVPEVLAAADQLLEMKKPPVVNG